MVSFAIRRLIQTIPVVFLTTVLIFLLLHLVPGDPAEAIAGPDATPAEIQTVRHELGIDQPLPVQYVLWIGRLVHGDFGQSYVNQLPVRDLILQRIPATLELTIGAILLEMLIAIPTGILAATHRRGLADWIISSFNALVLAIPNFWFAILAILLFALALAWLPPGGYLALQTNLLLGLKFLILPAAT